MTSIKSPAKRQHYMFWAAELTYIIENDGEQHPMTVRTNAMTVIPEKDKITPLIIGRAQQAAQMSVAQIMGEDFKQIKHVVSCTILHNFYMGFLTEEEIKIRDQDKEVPLDPAKDEVPEYMKK